MQSQTSKQSGNTPEPKRKRIDVDWSLMSLIGLGVAILLLVFLGIPLLMAVTVTAFLPHFPIIALFSGWTLVVLVGALVYLAIYWLRDDPEDEDENMSGKVANHVSASMAEQLRRNAGRPGQ